MKLIKPRFGLRSLLLLMTVIAVWIGIHSHNTAAQRKAVEAIHEYGGWVRYDYQFPSGSYNPTDFDGKAMPIVPAFLIQTFGIDFFQSVVQVSCNYSEDSGTRLINLNHTDAALEHLPSLPNLRALLLSNRQGSDDGLAHVGKLTRLEHLYMWDVSEVSDVGVAHLANLRRLKCIHLSSSKITDKSLKTFTSMPELEVLSLQFNTFSDAGVKQLTRLPRLKHLWVCGREESSNAITDDMLAEFERMQGLVALGIQRTRVTPAAVAHFKQAVPACTVYYP